MALSIIPSSIISFVISERETNVRHLQMTAGVSLPAYWLANFIVDLSKTAGTVGLMILIVVSFEVNKTNEKEGNVLYHFLLLYIPVIVPFTYAMSFCFKRELSAQVITLFLHFLTGGIMAPVQYFISLIETDSAQNVSDKLRWLL